MASPTRRVLFRCDASSDIGLGHVVRCLALAEELSRRGMEAWFASRPDDGVAFSLLEDRGHHMVPVACAPTDETDAIRTWMIPMTRGEMPFDTIVLDHYALGASWLGEASRLARQTVVIDDLADRPLPCNILVNANLGVSPGRYAGLHPTHTRLLLGSRYCLLRAGFAAAHDAASSRTYSQVRRILVTLGGTDQDSSVRLAIEAIQIAVPHAEVDLVVGKRNGTADWSEAHATRVHHLLDDAEMAQLMLDSDLAIGGGGMTSWERCAVALPSIAIRLAANQGSVVDALSAAGAAVDGGAAHELNTERLVNSLGSLAGDSKRRASIGRRAWDLIDGRGTVRVAHQIEGIKVRRARLGDSRLLWKWRNDPAIRAASIVTAPIPFADHANWLASTLRDPQTTLLIGSNGAGQLGQVRFDDHGDEAEVSISVASEHRGTVGGLLLRTAIREYRRGRPTLPILAQVKEENLESRRLFEATQFDLVGSAGGLLQYRLTSDIGKTLAKRETSQ